MDSSQLFSQWQIEKRNSYLLNSDEEREVWNESEGSEENQIIMHDYDIPTTVEFACAKDECKKHFNVVLYPEQQIYPRYCEKHRRTNNSLKRALKMGKYA